MLTVIAVKKEYPHWLQSIVAYTQKKRFRIKKKFRENYYLIE
jgi:hypothetical protein